ncbi:archaellin/type IV pilin N-terminal domain-containing protein [Natrinema halophilum]|uniref:Flagellin n=1 Tax=Natrinema halophilum TaxID=1699371 RepID=A0A7D5KSB6_9EURY|nr:archaellin/type IV pilin N-terminal domain-containing protein [Natrinema halophilum]QLG49264.1 flagellin [Natrinema halophilum]
MFEVITDNDDRGQVGIGTLIVFIAMVLVAAIAAGVLINTAGVLQSQASDTGSETQEAVANQIEVVHASGGVNESTEDGYVDSVNLTVMKSAGSNSIDLSSMTIQYTSDTTDKTLTHGGNDAAIGITENSYTDATPTTYTFGVVSGDANSTKFATTNIAGEAGGDSELISTDDRVKITLHLAAIEAGTHNESSSGQALGNALKGEGLDGGDSATIKLVDQSGAQFSYGLTVPSTFGDKEVVEV